MGRPLDRLLGRLAVRTGLVSDDQVQRALREQARREESGEPWTPLGQLLAEMGFLTDAGLTTVLELQRLHADRPNHAPLDPASPPLNARALGNLAALLQADPDAAPADKTRILGRYELVEELGHGGMGRVYKAYHKGLHACFAVKVLLAGTDAPPDLLRRFHQEAQAAARLKHPGIVTVHDVGEDDGRTYIAMEYVEGVNLDAVLADPAQFGMVAARIKPPTRRWGLLRRSPPPRVAGHEVVRRIGQRKGIHAESAVRMIRDIAEAMQAAHEAGVIHRDLKPANVLRDVQGRLKVMDFGLAKLVSGEEKGTTRTGMLLGTPAYMSPEQAGGRSHEIDARSDVYQIGALLYEFLTGRPPYDGDTGMAIVLKVLQTDPLPPRQENAAIDRDAETICLKAMAREKSRRYASARELAEDCRRFLAGEPILARPASRAYRGWRWAARNRKLVAPLAAAAALVLAVIGHYAIWPRFEAYREAARDAAARGQRALAAERALAGAHALFEAGQLEPSCEAARRVVGPFEEFARRGEDLPVGAAHALLGKVKRAQGDATGASAEFYRAYEIGMGGKDAARMLAELGECLLDQEDFERAGGVFEHALDAAHDESGKSEARLGLARAKLGIMDFPAARRIFRDLRTAPCALASQAGRIDRYLNLLDLVTPQAEFPFPTEFGLVAKDLDGDGRADLLGISADGREVVVSRFAAESLREWARCRVLTDEPYRLRALDALDLDGDGKPEILVAGGDAALKVGVLAVLRVAPTGISVVARAPLESTVLEHAFAAADLDGDGKRELILGTAWYERSLRIYKVADADWTLTLFDQVQLPGDPEAVAVRSDAGDGTPEIMAFVGPWGGFALLSLVRDSPAKGWVVRNRTPFGEHYAVCDDEVGRRKSILVGSSWYTDATVPLREEYGPKRFESQFLAPGAYEVRLQADHECKIVPLLQLPWPGTGQVSASVLPLETRDAKFAWVMSAQEGNGVSSAANMTNPIRVYEKQGESWNCLARMHPGDGALRALAVADLDGDGEPELCLGRPPDPNRGSPAALLVLGVQGKTATAESPPRASIPAPTTARPPANERSPVEAARLAEEIGLIGEAIDSYSRALKDPLPEQEWESAARGIIRCLCLQRKFDQAWPEAERLAASNPRSEAAIEREMLGWLEQTGRWGPALACAERLRSTQTLGGEERAHLGNRIGALRSLAEPFSFLRAADGGLRTCDLLATSPFCGRLDADSSLWFFASSSSDGGVFLPLDYAESSYRFAADLRVVQHDWGTNFQVGLVAGDPWAGILVSGTGQSDQRDSPRQVERQSAEFWAAGSTSSPVRSWRLFGDSGSAPYSGMTEAQEDLTRRSAGIRFSLEFAEHQRRLRGKLAGEAGSEDTQLLLDHVAFSDKRPYFGVCTHGDTGTTGYWAVVELKNLELQSGDRAMAVRPVSPDGAAALLFLANGRWIQGRTQDALAYYDRAVQAGDLEFSEAEAHRRRGVPSMLDKAWSAAFVRWVRVDARVWRGLLRAEIGDAAGCAADLDEADRASAERFRKLLESAALPLQEGPRPAAGLRAHFLQAAGLQESSDLSPFAAALLKDWGADLVNALLAEKGYRAKTVLRVARVDSQDRDCGVREGDLLATPEGTPLQDLTGFRSALAAARDAERHAFEVHVLRGDREERMRFEIDPLRVSLRVEAVARIRLGKPR